MAYTAFRETRRSASRELSNGYGAVVMVSPVVARYVAAGSASVKRCHVSRVGNGELPDAVRPGRGRVLDGCRLRHRMRHRGPQTRPWVSWRSGPRVRLSGWAGALGASGDN